MAQSRSHDPLAGGSGYRGDPAARVPLTETPQPHNAFVKSDSTGAAASLAGGRVLHVQLRHHPRHGEIAVVERQGARNAVLVKLEPDGIDRGLFPGGRGALFEIAAGAAPPPSTRSIACGKNSAATP